VSPPSSAPITGDRSNRGTSREAKYLMSQMNVELARHYFEAVNTWGTGDRTEHLRHPEIEFLDPPNLPDADRHVGEAAIRELAKRTIELGWDGRFHVQEYLGMGDEVVVIWRLRGRSAHGGGFPFKATFVSRCRFEDGKLRHIRCLAARQQHGTRAESHLAARVRDGFGRTEGPLEGALTHSGGGL
jgi:ketosteroid isomerase-like protein